MFNDLFNMLNAIAAGPAPTIDRTDINGFTVSTVNSVDCGPETAIIDSKHTVPVERYKSIEDAKIGHKKWVELITNSQKIVKVKELAYGDSLPEREIVLYAEEV